MLAKSFRSWALLALTLWLTAPLLAQEEVIRNRPGGEYLFTIESQLDATPVKDQARTGTCWSFSTVSFLESELQRMGKGSFDLSEMYVVRNIYPLKAELYVRMHGSSRLSEGGLFHDVNTVFERYGIVPEAAYSGLQPGQEAHNHSELTHLVSEYLEAVVANPNRQLSTRWLAGFEGILDAYLGELPETFDYEGETYTPASFAAYLGLDMDDYVELMSFTHQPMYEQSILQVPDNWDYHRMWNVPLDDLVDVVEHALATGYTVAWDADVSEKTFSHRNGVAVIPATEWAELGNEEQQALFQRPAPELTVTADLRQAAFDDLRTTDDHLMHIVGAARDQEGTRYYLVKNSWGETNACGGYVFVSEAYFRYKTIHIMLHQDGLPEAVAAKLTE